MFTAIYDFFAPRRWLAYLLFAGTLLIAGLLALRLNFEEDITRSLPKSGAIQTMNGVMAKTQAGEQLIFLARFKDDSRQDPDSLINAVTDYAAALQKELGPWIDTLQLQPAEGAEEQILSLVKNHLPLLLTEADYARIDSLLQPEKIRATMANNKRILLSPASVVYKQLVAADPLGISALAWQKLSALRQDTTYEIYEGFIFSKEQRQLSFFLKPNFKASETGKSKEFFGKLQAIEKDFSAHHPDVNIVWFGGPAVAAGNAAQMRQDSILTLGVSILLLGALVLYFFRRKRTPLLLFLPVAYGALCGLAVVYLTQGSMSIIALAAGAIVLGIAMDYGIHFLSHALNTGNMRETVKDLQQPLTLGSFTTIAAFFSLRLAHTSILRDLGTFAAVALLAAALCTLVFLPHFPFAVKKAKERKTIFDRLGKLRPEKSKILVWSIILLTPVMAMLAPRVQFDEDLMNLNYMSPKLRETQREVSQANAAALGAVFVVAEGRTEDEALHKLEQVSPTLEKLRQQGLIRQMSNPALLLPAAAAQETKALRWQNYWATKDVPLVWQDIAQAAETEGFQSAAFKGFRESLSEKPAPLDSVSVVGLKQLFPAGFAQDGKNYFAIAQLQVPASERQQVFHLLEQQKEVTVTDRQEVATQLVDILNEDFNNIALWTSLIVFFALLIGYGRIELAIIAFLPMVISWVWILGLMALLGLKFNIVNIIISTLIFGLGDDYAIFTMDGLVDKYKKSSSKLSSVRSAVYVSVTTVLIGLGVLLLAKHPALKSIAFISVVGLLSVVFISQTLQPFLYNWFIQNRADKKFLPFTLRSFLISVYAFTYFFTGSLVLSVLGVILTKLKPFGKRRSDYLFHRAISAYTWSMMYIMGNVRKRIYNRELADFSKPAIYIANHSSFLDILATTMLHPRLVLLTNRWVWRSPVFGAVVRMAEYYPVADGAEGSIEPLQSLVDRGYSIVIFPEGTRSYSDKMGRFHKGAFYLSEKLNIPIVPLFLHGVHYTMQKGDWLLKDGNISIYYAPRIAPQDPAFGEGYVQRTKSISRWYKSKFAEIKQQNETPSYFREQLIRSYTYKGPVLEWYTRIKTKLENNYELFHGILPRSGRVYDLGCGYGYASYLLHWAAPERDMVGVDYDAEKIAVAQGNFLRDDKISFQAADVMQFSLESCTGIVISDVLHYLLPAQQRALLERCVHALLPGGVLIIRDGVEELKERHKGTKLSELFSTKIFKFNKTRNELHFLSRKTIAAFAAGKGFSLEVIDTTKRTSNLTFVLHKSHSH